MLQNIIFFSQNELNKVSPNANVTNNLNLPRFEEKEQKREDKPGLERRILVQ